MTPPLVGVSDEREAPGKCVTRPKTFESAMALLAPASGQARVRGIDPELVIEIKRLPEVHEIRAKRRRDHRRASSASRVAWARMPLVKQRSSNFSFGECTRSSARPNPRSRASIPSRRLIASAPMPPSK